MDTENKETRGPDDSLAPTGKLLLFAFQRFPCISLISTLPLPHFPLPWLFPEKAAFPCNRINPGPMAELQRHLHKDFLDSTSWRHKALDPERLQLCVPTKSHYHRQWCLHGILPVG